MKKLRLLLITLMFGLLLCACGKKAVEEGQSVRIFYLDNTENNLKNEIHFLKGQTTKEKVVEVLTLLGETPNSKEMKPCISGGINIVNYALEDDKVTVSLGAKFLELSKTTDILTKAAIVKSLTQLEDINRVELTIEGEPLTAEDGRLVGEMTGEMFLDEGDDQLGDYQKVTIRLYFANETGDKLIPIDRSLVHNLDMSNVSMERLVIEQLLAGPVNQESYPTLNPDTKLLSITVKDGICYVNFDSAILTPVNEVTSDVLIYSVVNSLTDINGVNKVQISIDGRKDIKFKDKYDLSTLFSRKYDLLGD